MRKLICLLFCMLFLLTPLQAAAECRHTFSAWEDKGDSHSAVCTLCGETVQAQHEYEEYWMVDAESHSHRCLYCSHTTASEAHTWPENWEGEASGHYRLCTVCQTGGQSQDHSFGKATLVKWPLLFRKGRKEQTCTVCGYLHAQVVPPLKTLRIVLFCLAGAALLTAATVFTVRFIKKKKSKKENSRP